jgi:hypothetical protein
MTEMTTNPRRRRRRGWRSSTISAHWGHREWRVLPPGLALRSIATLRAPGRAAAHSFTIPPLMSKGNGGVFGRPQRFLDTAPQPSPLRSYGLRNTSSVPCVRG